MVVHGPNRRPEAMNVVGPWQGYRRNDQTTCKTKKAKFQQSIDPGNKTDVPVKQNLFQVEINPPM
jgi:hypothetical protein